MIINLIVELPDGCFPVFIYEPHPEGGSYRVDARVYGLGNRRPRFISYSKGEYMVGSTVLACRATLKLDDVLEKIERDLEAADGVRDLHPEEYSESDHHQDKVVIYIRGVAKVGKLYGPSIILGGIGIACLTKSHSILMERNAALTAAYVAIDKAFKAYRQRVVDRYGEETDRDLLYDFERVDVVDEETGKVTEEYRILPGEPSKYARWFDEECLNWHAPPFTEYNWVWLRNQQNWANDQLRSKGHMPEVLE